MAKTTLTTASKAGRRRASRLSPKQRQEQLLRFGVHAYAEKGIGNAKHSDIAKAAGISVSTVFDYFPSKGALVKSILDEVAREFRSIYASIDESSDGQSALINSGRLLNTLAKEKPEYVRVWLMWGAIYAPELQVGYQALESVFMEKAAALLKTVFPKNQDDEFLRDRVRLMVGAGTMLAKLALDEPSQERADDYVHHVMGVLLSPLA